MKTPTEKTVSFKATRDDATLIQKLMDKLGVGTSQIIRMGLRSLAKSHKVTLAS